MAEDKISVGFYAPMKAPSHAVASGDRQVARGFLEALRRANFAVEVVSDLRCYLADAGDSALVDLRVVMDAEFERLRNLWEADEALRPQLLFAYHVYHKSPDLLLYRLAEHFGLPYVIAEASYAAKRRGGIYDEALDLSAAAIRRADLILQLNSADMGGVEDLLRGGVRQVRLSPFMDVVSWRSGLENLSGAVTLPWGGERECIFMVHGMMRYGDKYRSYEVLAGALGVLSGVGGWRLVIIGGGEAEADVRRLFADFGDRVYFAGLLDWGEVVGWLGLADIYVWPAVGEAFGMGILEAVVLGLPVVVGDGLGVRGIVGGGGGILCGEGDVGLFGEGLLCLYEDYWGGGELLSQFRDYNWVRGMGEHDVSSVVSVLDKEFKKLLE